MKHVHVKKSQKLLLLLHGTGGDEYDLLDLGERAAPEHSLLGIKGSVLEQNMPRWFSRKGMNIFDEEEIKEKAKELYDFIQHFCQHENYKEIAIIGYSNGANMAAALLLLFDFPSKAALLHPLLPLTCGEQIHASILITAGVQDMMIPILRAKELESRLMELGGSVRFFSHQGGHEITSDEVAAIKEFFMK